MTSPLFRCDAYIALRDPNADGVMIEFLHGRHMTMMRFTLLEKETHRYSDVAYIDSLIQSFHKNPGAFQGKRRVTAVYPRDSEARPTGMTHASEHERTGSADPVVR